MKFDKNSTIGEVMDNEQARTLIVEAVPMVANLPMGEDIRKMTIAQVEPQLKMFAGEEAFNGLLEKLAELE